MTVISLIDFFNYHHFPIEIEMIVSKHACISGFASENFFLKCFCELNVLINYGSLKTLYARSLASDRWSWCRL